MTISITLAASLAFHSARKFGGFPDSGLDEKIHGHSFRAKLRQSGNSLFYKDFKRLEETLAEQIKTLNHRYLNEIIPNPTDWSIAEWVKNNIRSCVDFSVGIQSTNEQGIDIMNNYHRYSFWRSYQIHAAHYLPNVPRGHKCGRMHGHNFKILINKDIDLTKSRDFPYRSLDEAWMPLDRVLNMQCLNNIPGLENPTSELLALWVWNKLQGEIDGIKRVTVYETPTVGAFYDGDQFGIWKQLSFDSATRFKAALTGDSKKEIHLYTYNLKLFFMAKLDEILGWTIDYGDIKEKFHPVFKKIDHQPLFELDLLEDGDCISVAKWIRNETIKILPQLSRVEVYEKEGCGVILDWKNNDLYLPE